jgi:ketosteroid isomerase-like protein
MDHDDVRRWVDAYERAWREAGTSGLVSLFTEDATYRASPWQEPVEGLGAIGVFWEVEREGPDEEFSMVSEVVAVDGDTAVVAAQVEYGGPDPQRWRDLWVLRFSPDGRCLAFEEWPFAPEQRTGH